MTREDLEFIADALLSLCEKDRRAPFYSESIFRLKMDKAAKREPLVGHLLRRKGFDPLLISECRGVLARAALTKRQHEVLNMRLEGRTFEEIGSTSRSTRQGAQRVFSQAIKKLVRSFRVYPYVGLSEVYRRETRRGLRRSPRSTIKV